MADGDGHRRRLRRLPGRSRQTTPMLDGIVCADADNCPDDPNPTQAGWRTSTVIGDACDTCPADAGKRRRCRRESAVTSDNCPDECRTATQAERRMATEPATPATSARRLRQRRGLGRGLRRTSTTVPAISRNAGSRRSRFGRLGDACDARARTTASNDVDLDGVCGRRRQLPGEIANADQQDARRRRHWATPATLAPNDAANDADADGVCGDVDNCPGHRRTPARTRMPTRRRRGGRLRHLSGRPDERRRLATASVATVRQLPGDSRTRRPGRRGRRRHRRRLRQPARTTPTTTSTATVSAATSTTARPGWRTAARKMATATVGDACDACPERCRRTTWTRTGSAVTSDNCPTTANAGQEDADSDRRGRRVRCLPERCRRTTWTRDGVCGGSWTTARPPSNAGQEDADSDGLGDACDRMPRRSRRTTWTRDGVCGGVDNCPGVTANAGPRTDADSDGLAATRAMPARTTRRNDVRGLDGVALWSPSTRAEAVSSDLTANPGQARTRTRTGDRAMPATACPNDAVVTDEATPNGSLWWLRQRCPATANPCRAQADADSRSGMGDACDA